MSDTENNLDTALEETEQQQDIAGGEDAAEPSSPATMKSIDGEAAGEAAEEGSNTVQPPDSPDIISSYTAAEGTGEDPQVEGSAQEAEPSQPLEEEAQESPDEVPVAPTEEQAAPRSRPESGRPTSARPLSAKVEAASSGSRPLSGNGGPMEQLQQQEQEVEETGDREAQADEQTNGQEETNSVDNQKNSEQEQELEALDDERPPSGGGMGNMTEPSEVAADNNKSETAEEATATEETAAGEEVTAAGSRPVSRQAGSRPASGQAPAEPAPGTQQDNGPAENSQSGGGLRLSQQGSRPTSQAGESTQASRPGSQQAQQRMSSSNASASASRQSPITEVALELPSTASTQQPPKVADYTHMGIKVINVEINQGPGLPYKMVQAMLDYTQLQQKLYIGGFKNKRSGVIYHHAVTQTPRQPKYLGVERKLERETQTVKIAQRSQQTVREAATQMERPGVIIDTSEDRVKTPGRYQTSEEWLAIVTLATRVIQRFWRGYMGRKRASYLRQKKLEREAFLQEQEIKAKQEAEEHRRREIERRMHPRTAADFEILYNELEAWRLQETNKIKQAGLAKDKEQEVLQQLLHKETKLLQTIDRLKINANHENKEIRIQSTLRDMGKPKKFDLKNGNTVDVHTPYTTRAMELMQLYNGLNLPLLTIDERLDVLLHVKWTVKEFDCNLTREIVDLIDREADLLNRGRNERLLEGLRKRISGMFLTFIETPEFNPESARFQIVPMDFETYLFEQLGKATSRTQQIVGVGNSKWQV